MRLRVRMIEPKRLIRTRNRKRADETLYRVKNEPRVRYLTNIYSVETGVADINRIRTRTRMVQIKGRLYHAIRMQRVQKLEESLREFFGEMVVLVGKTRKLISVSEELVQENIKEISHHYPDVSSAEKKRMAKRTEKLIKKLKTETDAFQEYSKILEEKKREYLEFRKAYLSAGRRLREELSNAYRKRILDDEQWRRLL